jgi:F-type H+-transporting ATPase subunit O
MMIRTAFRSVARRSGARFPALVPRTFATADESSPWDDLEKDGAAHAPPLQLFGTPARFANAAYRQASREGVLEQVEKDLKTMTGLIAGEEELANFVNNPTAEYADKIKALGIIGKEYGFAEVTTGLLAVTAEEGKLNQLEKITDAYCKFMSAKRGDVVSLVTSAEKLSKKDEKSVRAALEARLKKGQQLILTTAVDPKIIGGLVVEFGDELADLSVSASLEDIGEALNSPGE